MGQDLLTNHLWVQARHATLLLASSINGSIMVPTKSMLIQHLITACMKFFHVNQETVIARF